MRTGSRSGLYLLLLFAALAGCQGSPSRHGFYDSPLLPGDRVEILREVVIPAGQARIYLQHGGTSGYAGIDQYAPFCYFLLRDPMPAEQTIEPQVLVVEKSWLNQTTMKRALPWQVASALSLGGGHFSLMAWEFHITLRKADDSSLVMVCSGAFDDGVNATPIRLPELREALGDFAQVRVREVSPGQ